MSRISVIRDVLTRSMRTVMESLSSRYAIKFSKIHGSMIRVEDTRRLRVTVLGIRPFSLRLYRPKDVIIPSCGLLPIHFLEIILQVTHNPSAKMPTGFFTLPRELRDVIYQYYVDQYWLESYLVDVAYFYDPPYEPPTLSGKELARVKRVYYNRNLRYDTASPQKRGKRRRKQAKRQARKPWNLLLAHPQICREAWPFFLSVCVLELSLPQLLATYSGRGRNALDPWDEAVQKHSAFILLDCRNYTHDSERHLCRLAIEVLGSFKSLRRFDLRVDVKNLPHRDFVSGHQNICPVHQFMTSNALPQLGIRAYDQRRSTITGPPSLVTQTQILGKVTTTRSSVAATRSPP